MLKLLSSLFIAPLVALQPQFKKLQQQWAPPTEQVISIAPLVIKQASSLQVTLDTTGQNTNSPAGAALYDTQAQFDEKKQLWLLPSPTKQVATYQIPELVVSQPLQKKTAPLAPTKPPSPSLKNKGPSTKPRVLVAQSLDSLDGQFSPVAVEAFRLVQEELQKMDSAYTRLISTHSGRPILVQKKAPPKRPQQVYPHTQNHTATQQTSTCLESDTDCQKNSPSTNKALPVSVYIPSRPATEKKHLLKQPRLRFPLRVKGYFAFQNGAAADGRQLKLSIYHMRDGQRINKARVFFKNALFDLKLDHPSGYIVGQITNSVGKVLAMGDINLHNPHNKAKLKSPGALNLLLKPYKSGVGVAVLAANSFRKKFLPQSRLQLEGLAKTLKSNKKGMFVDNSFTPDSSFLMRATHKNHWPTLITGIGDYKRQNLKLFSKKMVHALLSNVLDKRLARRARSRGVVWGRVLLNGKALKNAQVQMATSQEAVPVYFNGVLPDKKLTSTSSNGFFAFVNVPQGIASLRVQHEGRMWPANLIEVQRRHVSYVQLQAQRPRHVQVKTFDSFSGAAVSSRFRILGLDKEYTSLKGNKNISLIKAQGLMFIEVSQDKTYAASHHSWPASSKYVHLPRVPYSWINKMVPRRVKNVLVGFVTEPESWQATEVPRPKGDYKVALISQPDWKKTIQRPIIYFDNKGKKQKVGRWGGGFILLDVPLGMQSLVLSSPLKKSSMEVSSQMLALEQGLNITLFKPDL